MSDVVGASVARIDGGRMEVLLPLFVLALFLYIFLFYPIEVAPICIACSVRSPNTKKKTRNNISNAIKIEVKDDGKA